MLENEKALKEWRENTGPLREAAIDKAVGAYRHALGSAECPGEAAILAANSAAIQRVTERVLSPEWVTAITRSASCEDEYDSAQLELHFKSIRPELKPTEPRIVNELPPLQFAIAAILGAIGGMMILTPLARFLLNMEDVGTFVGAPAGAALLVVALWYSARSAWIRGALTTMLGVAAIHEVWAIVTGGGVFGRVWRILGGRRSGIKRLLLFVGVILLLLLTKCRRTYDRDEHERLVRFAVGQWLNAAILTLGVLLKRKIVGPDPPPPDLKLVQRITQLPRNLYALREMPHSDLVAVVHELVLIVKNETNPPPEPPEGAFQWETKFEEHYEVFGSVEPGDWVVEERVPVILHGCVHKKGLVRKTTRRG